MRRACCLTLAVSALACGRGAADRAAQSSPTPTASASAPSAAATPEPIDGTTPLPNPLPMIAARVNGRPIPTSQVMIAADPLIDKGVFKGKVAAYRSTLNQLVIRELLLEEAIARKLVADEASVQRAYDELRVGYKDDAAWAEFLRTQAMTAETFRIEVRTKQTVAKLLSKEAEKAPGVSEEEARRYYDQHPKEMYVGERLKVAHILLPVPQNAPTHVRAEARTRAIDIQVRLRTGQDFAKLAERYSGDTMTAKLGGILEPFSRGQMPQAFEDAAFALKPGEVSEAVETPFGFHVIRLIERIPGSLPGFEEIKEPLLRQLAARARQEHIQAFINELKSKAKIETFL